MKTLGGIVIIIIVFALVMDIAYAVVNATRSSSTGPQFVRGDFNRPDGDRPQFPQGTRPDFGDRRREELSKEPASQRSSSANGIIQH